MRNLIFGAVLVFFLVQCATVTRTPMQRILVDSEPVGASVQLSECGAGSRDLAKTPGTVLVNRRATHCTLAFTHPEYGTRTVSLLRTGRAMERTGPPAELLDAAGAVLGGSLEVGEAVPIVGVLVGAIGVSAVVVSGTIWGASRAVDGIAGANYEQNRSRIVIDFNEPVPNVAGRYSLMGVNGKELPAPTWSTRDGKCQIWTNSGWLVLEENGRWSSTVTEQQFCGNKKRSPVENTARGVFTIEGDRVLLESEAGRVSAVIQGDRLDLTAKGARSYAGQTAVYTLQRPQ